ncbi:MAG: hypothetical protein DRQ51_04490 [Gammaproteobacteria bacterium]|nr:MAG: hypothetical protein DRQ51_04490 [Gammaproteobacteria bacterium]
MIKIKNFQKTITIMLLGILFFTSFDLMAKTDLSSVPESLKDWVPWVLDNDKKINCPYVFNDKKIQICEWQTNLELDIKENNTTFKQYIKRYNDGFSFIVGNIKNWPQNVITDNKRLNVINKNGKPAVFLKAGNYTIEGIISHKITTNYLQLPANISIVNLKINKEIIPYPVIDKQGKLWLKKDNKTYNDDDVVDIRVYRQVVDDIPLYLNTHLDLKIFGKNREIELGSIFDNTKFVPIEIISKLPAKLDSNGVLKIKTRPGSWQITIKARHKGKANILQIKQAINHKNKSQKYEEIWIFTPKNNLHISKVTGVKTINSQNTSIPKKWQKYQAYKVSIGDEFKITKKIQGNPDPVPDNINLSREFWLDSDGDGWSISDEINGVMNKNWRLNVDKNTKLGRVRVNNTDRFITSLPSDNLSGVEIREGKFTLKADSRLKKTDKLQAVGWLKEASKLDIKINLPPGWGLWHISGADKTDNTYFDNWSSLLDMFIVLILSMATFKLFNYKWAIFVFISLLLVYHKAEIIPFLWLNILLCLALLKALPANLLFTKIITIYRNISFFALIAVSLVFMVQQARVGLYPQLEYANKTISSHLSSDRHDYKNKKPASKKRYKQQQESKNFKDSFSFEKSDNIKLKQRTSNRNFSQSLQIDTKNIMQTGAGKPQWQWNRANIFFNGAVSSDAKLNLYLISPTTNRILSFLRSIMVGIITLFLLLSIIPKKINLLASVSKKVKKSSVAVLLLFAVPLLIFSADTYAKKIPPPKVQKQEIQAKSGFYPDQKLLQQLKNKISKKPVCLPNCATISDMNLIIRNQTVKIKFQVHSEINTAIPLFGNTSTIFLKKLLLNDKNILLQNAGALYKDKKEVRWLNIPSGISYIQLEGLLADVSQIQLPFNLQPITLYSDIEGWTTTGIHKDQFDRQLKLSKIQTAKDNKKLTTGKLPPFMQVERTLVLGHDWQVFTKVQRLSPTNTPIIIEIPLLDGETILDENKNIKNNNVLVNMSEHMREYSWISKLDKTPQIKLTAPDTDNWNETWYLNPSSLWHFKQISGINSVDYKSGNVRIKKWQPMGGESVVLDIIKPVGVAGEISTIKQSSLKIIPESQNTATELKLNIYASQAYTHQINLNKNAKLKDIKINNKKQSIRLKNGKIDLPINPGENNIKINFIEKKKLKFKYQTSLVNLNKSSMNHQIKLQTPHNRWVLFVSGPLMGPAVLFWGNMLVIILISLVLGRIKITPIKTYQWVLLSLVVAQLHVIFSLIIVGWLLLLGWRKTIKVDRLSDLKFNAIQVVILLLSIVAIITLFATIENGLLGNPDMSITGNLSSSYAMNWYQDKNLPILPQTTIYSIPLFVYKIGMLLWSLWLAIMLLKWLVWGWKCYSNTSIWRKTKILKSLFP